MRHPSISDHIRFIYPKNNPPMLLYIADEIQSIEIGAIVVGHTYLLHEQQYYRVCSIEEHEEQQIFTCVEATVEDWLRIKHYLFDVLPAREASLHSDEASGK